VARCPTDHPLRVGPDGQRSVVLDVHGDDRGLVQHDAPTPHVNERTCVSTLRGFS
jgi:hypothetical protein